MNLQKSSLSNRIRKGCNCKKSNCKKKYCECYSANQVCTELCKCEGCYNRKDDRLDNPDNDQYNKRVGEDEEDAKEKEVLKKTPNKKVKKEDSEQNDNKIQIKKDSWKK